MVCGTGGKMFHPIRTASRSGLEDLGFPPTTSVIMTYITPNKIKTFQLMKKFSLEGPPHLVRHSPA